MEHKHSPAPWRYESGNVYAADGTMVAQDLDGPDGRLVAQTPALLDLAEQALGQLALSVNTGLSVDGDLRDDLRRIIEAAAGQRADW